MNENSNRIMFQQGFKAGQEDMKKKLLEETFNLTREEIIKLIEKI